MFIANWETWEILLVTQETQPAPRKFSTSLVIMSQISYMMKVLLLTILDLFLTF